MPLRIGSRGGARLAGSSRTLVAVPYPEPIRRSERDASYNPIGRAYAACPPQTTLLRGAASHQNHNHLADQAQA